MFDFLFLQYRADYDSVNMSPHAMVNCLCTKSHLLSNLQCCVYLKFSIISRPSQERNKSD